MYFTSEQNSTLDLALSTWGHDSQEQMFIGEIGELLTMFGRRAQNRDTYDKWIDELADCAIMLEQMIRLRSTDDVAQRIDEKMERLKSRLSKYQNIVENLDY